MPITVNENGTLYELSEIYANESGTLYELDTVHSNEGGTLYEIHSAWKPPDTLAWKITSTGTVTPTNNGYNCTITRGYSSSFANWVSFTISKPTRIKVSLDNHNWNSVFLQGWKIDDNDYNSIDRNTDSFTVDVQTPGEHTLTIGTSGDPLQFIVTMEKI